MICEGIKRQSEEKKLFDLQFARALTVHVHFRKYYIHSVSLPFPTASSEVDQSPFVSEEWAYVGAPVKLLRVMLPQLPALPERTWLLRGIALLVDTRSFAIGYDVAGFGAEGVEGEAKSRSTSVPLKE